MRVFGGTAIALITSWGAAWAQVPQPAGAVPPEEAAAEAAAHLKKGTEYFDKKDYSKARDEYRKSTSLRKTANAMGGEASSLKQLKLYDEALQRYQAMVEEFPNMSSDLASKVHEAIDGLKMLMGTVKLSGDAPAGAKLTIDKLDYGKLSPDKELYLSEGPHTIVVTQDGFEPITKSVNIKMRTEEKVVLEAKSRQGKLSIREKHNWPLNIEIDGKDIGHTTPWDAPLAVGDHQVRLHGDMGVDALIECAAPDASAANNPRAPQDLTKMASKVEPVTVKLYEVTPLTLDAEDQTAPLHIESSPSGATLKIDAQNMGRTPWDGQLSLDKPHTIELSLGGFLPSEEKVKLTKRERRSMQMGLRSEPVPIVPNTARSVGAGVAYGVGALGLGLFAVTGSLAVAKTSDVKSRCEASLCPTSEQGNLDAIHTLGKAATAGLVVGGAGVVAGTIILIAAPSQGKAKGAGVRAGVGLGRLEIEGEF